MCSCLRKSIDATYANSFFSKGSSLNFIYVESKISTSKSKRLSNSPFHFKTRDFGTTNNDFLASPLALNSLTINAAMIVFPNPTSSAIMIFGLSSAQITSSI